ncbi:MAG: hypothetical protein ACM3JF_03200 [Sphaerimonospora mesophila]
MPELFHKLVGPAAIVAAAVLAVIVFDTPWALVGFLAFVGLVWGVRFLRGRALKVAALGLLIFATIAGPLVWALYNMPGINFQFTNDAAGLTGAAYLLIWLVLLPIVWLEYRKTKKPGLTQSDIDHSYRVIIIGVTLFELSPLLISVYWMVAK